jgi:hypothetical protein
MANDDGQDLLEEAKRLYDRYAKPLESLHLGEHVAVSRTGETILSSTLREAVRKASDRFGPGNFVFKVGERSVGKWRSPEVG